MDNQILKFIRQKDYVKIREIGRGGLGTAVLIRDSQIEKDFVCKKYSPVKGINPEEYFGNFLQEIKLMFDSNNSNIIRIYNYYLYPEYTTGYIIMEYVEGEIISKYIKENTEKVNNIFEQVINAFQYLEERKIIHRDIRDTNILVTHDGIVKIIDFGFGKKIEYEVEKYKSISLNWWCETPDEFKSEIYDGKTDIYFIGKLFEQLLRENNIDSFLYIEELRKMIVKNADDRIASFSSIANSILSKTRLLDNFSDSEKELYQLFANSLCMSISKIEKSSRYLELPIVVNRLEVVYQQNMLEQYVQNPNDVANAFISGSFYYRNNSEFYVYYLQNFIDLLKRMNAEKQKILMMNIQNRLNKIVRYDDGLPPDFPDDIPF